ncbi:tryptophan halogenase [Cellvibrio zantedeschiae]|uniref:Tryptophan halogenase n=1 Tax=Cellvibrio zantedeschiae TaxID=1237077 RepID=A0ABQ3BDW0_9GAMM|nr:tryptophan halogenase family protein [Cellvibrio zantedeschiae]GGY85904.1 tryptophan halogenase [Cellvibrio zantedeschiae]
MTAKKILIVGGGTAGWMTALIMARAWLKQGFEIRLIESPEVGIIGVGEGSTPALKQFFDKLGIAESEWMPECNATYKSGIRFDHWSTKPNCETYFHPFASSLDPHTLPLFMRNAHARVRGLDVYAHPDRFFLTAKLAEKNLAPKAHYNFPFEALYGYHFDAVLLGQFLKKKAIAMGVGFSQGHVQDVLLDEVGDITAVVTKDGEHLAADFFVDCTGFRSLLLRDKLKTPFKSFRNNLFNDAAVAMPTEIGAEIPSCTISTALKNGWAWKIPLTNRYGNGYVYSSDFCSADDAEFELRERLGLLDADIPVRHLKMVVGQVTQHWNRNCLAVGLSQGFIEPLEATALFLVQQTAAIFTELYERGNFTAQERDTFNARITGYFEGTRDYIVTHYKTSTRNDTEYWRANIKDQTDVSDTMKILYEAWMSGKDMQQEVTRLAIENYYAAPSWVCLLAGMGIFPSEKRLRKATEADITFSLGQLDDFLTRSALNFDDHRQYLEQKL